MSMYGPENVEGGQILIENLSRSVWEAQQDPPEESDSEEKESNDGAGSGGNGS